MMKPHLAKKEKRMERIRKEMKQELEKMAEKAMADRKNMKQSILTKLK